jgi:hypothetical protein
MLISLVQAAVPWPWCRHWGLASMPLWWHCRCDGPRRRVYLASHDSPTPAAAAFLSLLAHYLPPDQDGASA